MHKYGLFKKTIKQLAYHLNVIHLLISQLTSIYEAIIQENMVIILHPRF